MIWILLIIDFIFCVVVCVFFVFYCLRVINYSVVSVGDWYLVFIVFWYLKIGMIGMEYLVMWLVLRLVNFVIWCNKVYWLRLIFIIFDVDKCLWWCNLCFEIVGWYIGVGLGYGFVFYLVCFYIFVGILIFLWWEGVYWWIKGD